MHFLIVGIGSIGERHLRSFQKIEGVRCSIAEVNPTAREKMAAQYHVEAAYADYREADLKSFDGVVICTPTNLHIPIAADVVSADTHVLMEKPLGMSLDGVEELKRLRDEKGFVVSVAFTLRSDPISREVKERVASASSLIARFIGAQKHKEANNAGEHTLLIIVVLSVLMSGLGPLLTKPLFRLLGASEEMLPLILSYINIVLYGSFFLFFVMIGNGILRGEGNMVKPMQVMIVGTVVNIVLDPILIFGIGPIPALGVEGAALATVSGRAVSCIILFRSLFSKRNIIKIDLKSFTFSLPIVRGIFGVGGPTIFSQLSYSLGLSLLFILLRPYGDVAKAAFTIGFTYQQIAILPVLGIAQGTLIMAGQNFGAKNYLRIKMVMSRALGFSVVLMTAFALVFIIGRGTFMRVFTQKDEIIAIGRAMMMIFSLGFPFLSGRIILSSFFQGLGMGIKALVLNLAQMLVLAIPLALLLSVLIGLEGVWTGMLLANVLSALLGLFWAGYTNRKLIRELVREQITDVSP